MYRLSQWPSVIKTTNYTQGSQIHVRQENEKSSVVAETSTDDAETTLSGSARKYRNGARTIKIKLKYNSETNFVSRRRIFFILAIVK